MRLSTAVRRVWQQFSRLHIVPPCVADVATVDCTLCRHLNKRTLLLLLLLLLLLYLEIHKYGDFYRFSDVRPPFTYAALIRQVR